MKKFFLSFFFILVFSHFAFSKPWTNNAGAGVTGSFSLIGIDGEDDIKQFGYGVECAYIGFHESGFTVKANVAFGLGLSQDIAVQDRKTNIGAFENVAIGAGYSFVRTEKVIFGTTAMFGIEMGQYSDSEDDVEIDGDSYNTSTSISLLTLSFGADVFGIYRISQKFGLFANLEARYLFVGSKAAEYQKDRIGWRRKTSTSKSSNDDDLFGKFIVQPTIGVMWTF